MNRRQFFAIPIGAVIPATFESVQENFIMDVPGPGNTIRAPIGALEVRIEGKIYHAYLWEPQ